MGSPGRTLHRCLASLAACAATGAFAQLALDPPNPTPLDTVRLRYYHVGCTDPDSVQVSLDANRVTVQADRRFAPDCGTVAGSYDEYTLGRLPTGEYEAMLVVNPPPGTFAPSQLLGPLHVSVSRLPPTGTARPHDDYSDMWWNGREPGWALSVRQSGEKVFLVWNTYADPGKPTWFVVPGGSWTRDADGRLHFAGTVYRTTGAAWQLPFDPTLVGVKPAGTADFLPLDPGHALFTYTIDGMSGAKAIVRFRF